MPKWLVVLTLIFFFQIRSCSTDRSGKSYLNPTLRAENAQPYQKRIETSGIYAKQNGLSKEFVFLADVSQRSGSERFFVVNLEKGEVVASGLMAHGHCNDLGIPFQFSNEPGSHCTSEGRYRIHGKYHGMFGTAYKLHGLDSSNSNAFDRFIVLHAHRCVPRRSTIGPICRSEGCPTVSPAFLETLESYLDVSDKPIMLWIFNDQTAY